MTNSAKMERWDDLIPHEFWMSAEERQFLNRMNDWVPTPPREPATPSNLERLADWLVLCLTGGFIDNKTFNQFRWSLGPQSFVPEMRASPPATEAPLV